METKKSVGDRLTVRASTTLGTHEEQATVLRVRSWGYEVALDSDPNFPGPVDFDGNPLSSYPR